MKRIALILLFLLVPNLVRAQQKKALSAASATCTTTSCLSVTVDQTQGGATFTISANPSGNTIQFEASGDGGSTVVAISATPSNSSTSATSTASTGTWQVNTSGYTNLYLRMSTLVGGTTTVSIIQGLPSARGGSGGGGGGGVASCATFANGDIAFYTAATTLGCNDQLQWDNTNNHQYTGDPQSSFTAGFQNYLGTKSMKQWDAGVAVAGANFTGLFVQEEGTTTEPIGIYVATRSQDQNIIGINSDLNGNVAMGQTVPLGVNINLGSGWIGPGSVTLHKDIVASPNYSGGVIVGESNGYWGNSVVVGPTTAITNNYDFHSAMDTVSAGGTITNNYAFAAGNHGGTATTFSAAFFADTQTSADGHSWAFYNASGKSKFNLVTLDTLSTGTNCAANGTAANPSIVACGAASAGMFSCATAATTGTCQVNTTAVTANSEIFITQDAADGGAGQLNVTCNTALVTPAAKPILLSKNAGTSFTINLGTVSVNPGCFQFQIIN